MSMSYNFDLSFFNSVKRQRFFFVSSFDLTELFVCSVGTVTGTFVMAPIRKEMLTS